MLSLLVYFLSVLFSIRINKVSFHVVLLKLVTFLVACLFLFSNIYFFEHQYSCQSKPPFSFIVFLI